MKRFSELLRLSGLAIFIFGWWLLAFSPASVNPAKREEISKKKIHAPLLEALSTLDRNELQKALSGDIALMTRLIADWDVDAQLLEVAGKTEVMRLMPHSYLRSQILGRQLVRNLDNKKKYSCELKRYLPQTYASASFLLALVQPEQIVGLPKGLRHHTHLFAKESLQAVSCDIDRCSAETLFMIKPHAAFIAHYSHPASVENLKNQGVSLVTLSNQDSVAGILTSLKQVGEAVEKPCEAEMLALFIEAAMLTIDNRINIIKSVLPGRQLPQTLFVNYYANYTLPTHKTLTGQLLQRLRLLNSIENNEWAIPIDQETILNQQPECLIVATPDPDAVKNLILSNSAMQNLPAVTKDNLFFVDEVVQQFPSQYVVLAYYDLFHILASTNI